MPLLLERRTTLAVALSLLSLAGCGSTITDRRIRLVRACIEFVADPSTVAPGDNAWLSWTGHNATSCEASGALVRCTTRHGRFSNAAAYANDDVHVELLGTQTVAQWRASRSNRGRSSWLTARLRFRLRSQKGSIPASGNTVLEWNAANATECTASGGWSGNEGESWLRDDRRIEGRYDVHAELRQVRTELQSR